MPETWEDRCTRLRHEGRHECGKGVPVGGIPLPPPGTEPWAEEAARIRRVMGWEEE